MTRCVIDKLNVTDNAKSNVKVVKEKFVIYNNKTNKIEIDSAKMAVTNGTYAIWFNVLGIVSVDNGNTGV